MFFTFTDNSETAKERAKKQVSKQETAVLGNKPVRSIWL